MVSSIASRSGQRLSSTRMKRVSTGMSWNVASTIMPVSPMPPTVAQKTSGVPSGVTVNVSPPPVSRVIDSTLLPKVPSR